MKKRLKNIFEKNEIPNFEKEGYNEHLSYFKEAVLDDRLNFNQTNMLEVLGKFFLKYWELMNSPSKNRITDAIQRFIAKNGRLEKWKIEKPENMTEIEMFYWEIKGISFCKGERINEFIPVTDKYLIERDTSENNMIKKHS